MNRRQTQRIPKLLLRERKIDLGSASQAGMFLLDRKFTQQMGKSCPRIAASYSDDPFLENRGIGKRVNPDCLSYSRAGTCELQNRAHRNIDKLCGCDQLNVLVGAMQH